MKGIKITLGVRECTANDLCLIEMGLPALKSYVQERQHKFFEKHLRGQELPQHESPLLFALQLHKDKQTKTFKYIEDVTTHCKNSTVQDITRRKERIRVSERSKDVAYVSLNPNLTTDGVYTGVTIIPEYQRINFSRLRCISHSQSKKVGGREYHATRERVAVEKSKQNTTLCSSAH